MNIKKLLFLLIFVLLLGFGCDCSSNTDDECKHEIESVASKEATCTNEGNVEYFYCTKCNKYYIDKELTKEKSYDELVIVKKGHNYSDYEIKKEATEDEAGIKVRKCNTCGEEEIHSFDYTGSEVDINNSFVTIDVNTYYVVNNNIVKNYYIIDDVMYDFGDDGVKQETVLTDKIITFEDNLYYVINNIIQKEVFIVYEQYIYYFDADGKALINTTYNGYTFGVDGYLIADNLIITINETIYEVVNNIASVHKHNYVNGVCTVCSGKEIKIIINNGYVYFGEYPQTLKKESVIIVSDASDNDGYYLGSDGERYAKVFAKQNSSSLYFNDETTKIVNGEIYYFKVEPIKWKIEEEVNGTYKLICDLIIDLQQYNSSSTIKIDSFSINGNNYMHSDIRNWLNNKFLNKAFTKEEQEKIEVTEVDNSVSSTGGSNNRYACGNTMDKIYLPSVSEMTTSAYGYNTESSAKDNARLRQSTDYAKAVGCSEKYWLRSPSGGTVSITKTEYYAYYVNGSGSVTGDDSADASDVRFGYGVVPALTIKID